MRPTPRAYVVACGVGVPLLLVLLGTAMTVSQREHLPVPLAVHWASDVVTGTAGLNPFLLVTGLQVLGVCAIFLALAARMPRAARPTLVGTGVGLATFLGLTGYGIVMSQRGLADPSQAPNPTGSVMGAALLGVIAGIAVAHGFPGRHRVVRASLLPAEAVRLSEPVEAPRFSAFVPASTRLAGVFAVVLVGSLIVLALTVADWWLVVSALLVGLGVASILFPVVTVGPGGLRARGLGVVPWLDAGLGEVHWAQEITDTSPALGLRRSAGGQGSDRISYRTRPGTALQVHLHDGTTLVLTCPRAGTAAAVLNTLVERRAVEVANSGDGRLTGAA